MHEIVKTTFVTLRQSSVPQTNASTAMTLNVIATFVHGEDGVAAVRRLVAYTPPMTTLVVATAEAVASVSDALAPLGRRGVCVHGSSYLDAVNAALGMSEAVLCVGNDDVLVRSDVVVDGDAAVHPTRDMVFVRRNAHAFLERWAAMRDAPLRKLAMTAFALRLCDQLPVCTWSPILTEADLANLTFDGLHWWLWRDGWHALTTMRARDVRAFSRLAGLDEGSGDDVIGSTMHAGVPLVWMPRNARPPWVHAGDGMREALALLQSRGGVRVHDYDVNQQDGLTRLMGGHVWFGPCILYDWDIPDWYRSTAATLRRTRAILSGNSVFPGSTLWSYWPRRPALMASILEHPLPTYAERRTRLLFLGKVENRVQASHRAPDVTSSFAKLCDEFHLSGLTEPYKYSPTEYLARVRDARFGLSFRGFGPKCNRDIEYAALGVIPLVMPDVDMDGFHERMVEGMHYFCVKDADDAVDVLARADNEATWTRMSEAIRAWYARNSTPEALMRLAVAASTCRTEPCGPSSRVPPPS